LVNLGVALPLYVRLPGTGSTLVDVVQPASMATRARGMGFTKKKLRDDVR
jgi:hypothetical protein